MSLDLDNKSIQTLQDIANQIRIYCIQATTAANSGYVTSCCSAAEIMSTLFFNVMHYDAKYPRDPSSDRFVLSKGHAASLLYAVWTELGFLKSEDMLKQYAKLGSVLEGYPSPRAKFVDVATGSLGQGICTAAGMAYTAKNFDKASYRVFCLLGDGETAEGSVWEAIQFASLYKLDNLVVVIDVNRFGQTDVTPLEHRLDVYDARFNSFGWNVIIVDGHNIAQLAAALNSCPTTVGRPTVVIAKTIKGKGISEIEDKPGWHGKVLSPEAAEKAIAVLRSAMKTASPHGIQPPPPTKDAKDLKIDFAKIRLASPPQYRKGEKVSTGFAYGTALVKLGKNCDQVIVLDSDVKVSVANGCAVRGRTIPFCSTFAAFFARASDQLRMAAQSRANIKCCGAYAGLSAAEDGPNQMGLEDLALFRSLPGAIVFCPADAVATERAVELAARAECLCYIRTSPIQVPVIYSDDDVFEVGKAKMCRQSSADRVLIIGSGFTIFEAERAADELAHAGINAAVLDPFTIKPLDVNTIVEHVRRVQAIVTVEDHYIEGGLGEAVSSALMVAGVIPRKFEMLAIRSLPTSGSYEQLSEDLGISATAIVRTVNDLLS